jgi:hypothetical protein
LEVSSLKVRIIWFIATVVVVLLSPSIAAASNTTTKFDTGPFNCSVDLNTPCHDIIIGKPIHKEMMDGTGYVNYPVDICGVLATCYFSLCADPVVQVEIFDSIATAISFAELASFLL